MKRNGIAAIFAVFVILFACFAGVAGGYIGSRIRPGASISEAVNSITQDVRVTNEESAIIDVANNASGSVVSIVITEEVPVYENYFYNPYEGDPFFRNFSIPQRRQTGTEQQQVGAGTGFIISDQGLIVTNKHVVDNQDASYTVIMNDGTKYDAKVLARDTLIDIAFIKIEASGLKPLTLGTSSNLKVGQTAIAIGNALGQFSNTVSAGIISGLQRDIVAGDASGSSVEQLTNVIQTDASINPGNSGGPLLNINGEVIGVNVAVAQDAQNIGFAIPVDVVKDLVNRLNTEGSIIRPVLGVRYIPINESVQKQNNLSVNYGALVQRGTTSGAVAVIPGSPADKAGIRENDIILEVNGTKVEGENSLQTLIASKRVGDKVTLKILRGGQNLDVEVTLDQAAS